MKRIIALMLAVVMAVSLLAGCSTEKKPVSTDGKVEFTDSLGRTVKVPADIKKVAISGPLAQIVVFALAPDRLVGIASEWDESAKELLDTQYYELPLLGQLYGGKGEMNLETLLASGAEVVIDVGESKDGMKEDLDSLSDQTGIPFVHVDATLSTMGDAYRKLGELLAMKDEAETIASYCEDTYKRTKEIADGVSKVKLLYCLGDAGINVIAKGSYHAEVIDMLSDNLAVVSEPSSKGSGNEVDMEQILLWNPDYIIFAPDSIYDTVGNDDIWKQVKAIGDGHYYEVPFGPYNWFGFPPSVQRYLGMIWMAKTLYPDKADYDLYTEVAKYFDMFYHKELTKEQYDSIVAAK